ncbi:MAG: succinylglutamate desuccinylase/aspartoacylase family protein [Verrucomicrobiota bacterium]
MVKLGSSHPPYPHKLRRLYWPFLALAEESQHIVGTVAGSFDSEGKRYTIPRFSFLGPQTSVPRIRLGLFALLHGDEPAGAVALERLLARLVDSPELATGYELVLYPLCNPTGYEDGTRHTRAGFDLNREFWRASQQPEIHILEEELRAQQFHGIITLHADDTCEGHYGYSHGQRLDDALLRPALLAAERVLPRDRRSVIDGFTACEGVITDCFKGILSCPPTQSPRAFNLIFETPALAPLEHQVSANVAALEAILATYRGFIAYAQDL